MEHNIIVAGVGGQGVLLIAEIIARAGFDLELHVKQAEVHGMAQRGGAVMSHLRLADHELHSPLVPKGTATLLLGLEPLESLRYLHYLARDGWLLASSSPVGDIADYPDIDRLLQALQRVPRARLLEVETIARNHGAAQASNLVMLGAAAHLLELEPDAVERIIEHRLAGDPV